MMAFSVTSMKSSHISITPDTPTSASTIEERIKKISRNNPNLRYHDINICPNIRLHPPRHKRTAVDNIEKDELCEDIKSFINPQFPVKSTATDRL